MNERQLDAEIARKAAEIAANEEVLKCAEDYSNNVYAARVAYREKGGHVANIELPTTRSLCDKLSSYNIRDVSSEKADIAERQCTRANELFFSWTLRIRVLERQIKEAQEAAENQPKFKLNQEEARKLDQLITPNNKVALEIFAGQREHAYAAASKLKRGMEGITEVVHGSCTRGLGPARGSAMFQDVFRTKWGSAVANRFVDGYHKAVTEITETATASQEQLRAFWPDAEPAAGLTLLQGISADAVPPPDFQQQDHRSMSHLTPSAAADPVTPSNNQQQTNSLSLHDEPGAERAAAGELLADNSLKRVVRSTHNADEEGQSRGKVHRTGAVPASAAEALTAAAIAAQAVPQPDDDADMLFARQLAACGRAAYRVKMFRRHSS